MDPIDEAKHIRRGADELRSEQEVRARIAAMAAEISARLEGSSPVVLPIMLGGLFLTTELCRHLDFPYELDYVHVRRYYDTLDGGRLEWLVRPRVGLEGRTVLLVDDVLDRGVTLAEVMRELRAREPAKLVVAVLASKAVDATSRPPVDYVGFACPNRYLFGCGMDYKGFWRGLPALYAVAT